MVLEGLRNRIQTMRENQAIGPTPAADVKVVPSNVKDLASDEGLSFADRFKARFGRSNKIDDGEFQAAMEQAKQVVEGNQLLGAAARRVVEHDDKVAEQTKAMETAAVAKDRLHAAIVGASKPGPDFSRLSTEALTQLANREKPQVDPAELIRVRDEADATAAQAELDKRAALGDLPRLSIDAERSHVERSEKAQAEMLVYGKRVTAAVEEFGNKANEGHRVYGDVDKITAANALLKQEGPTVALLRKAERDFVQQLESVARLQARRDGTPEDEQENLDQIVYQHTEARRQIREKAANAQPIGGYGNRCLYTILDPALKFGPDANINQQFSSLSKEGIAAVKDQFGTVQGDPGREALLPKGGTLAAELAGNYGQLGALMEARKQATEICRQHPEAADALYLIALQEAKLAQVIATQVVKLRTEVKLAVAEQHEKEKQFAAEQAQKLNDANRAKARAEKYGRIRKGILGKVKGGTEWVQRQVTKLESATENQVKAVSSEQEQRVTEGRNKVDKVLQNMLKSLDGGQMTEATFMGIVGSLGYQNVDDVRRKLEAASTNSGQ